MQLLVCISKCYEKSEYWSITTLYCKSSCYLLHISLTTLSWRYVLLVAKVTGLLSGSVFRVKVMISLKKYILIQLVLIQLGMIAMFLYKMCTCYKRWRLFILFLGHLPLSTFGYIFQRYLNVVFARHILIIRHGHVYKNA